MGWTIKESWLDYRQGQEVFLFKTSTLFVGTIQPPIQWVLGTRVPG
jgi:hypothetical protein